MSTAPIPTPRPLATRQVGFVAVAAVLLLGLCTTAALADFAAPGRSGLETWQAELATGADRAQVVTDPLASAGRYVDSGTAGNVVLEFPFTMREEGTLRLRSLWWRTGDARAAKLYPYPLSPNPGPDLVVADGKRLFFTAPQAGRVGLADAETRRVLGFVPVGGYLTDLLIDTAARRVWVTDALGDRLVLLDADAAKVTGEIKLPTEPWSMVQTGGSILVACRAAKTLAVVDPNTRKITRTVNLPSPPINLELRGNPPTTLAVRFQQPAYSAQDLRTLVADELQYGTPGERTSVAVGRQKKYLRGDVHLLRLDAGNTSSQIDVSEATKAEPVAAALDYPLTRDPGPTRLEVCGKYLFFTAPAVGRVGVVSTADDKLVKVIPVGGYPVDLVAVPTAELLYVADALGNRVVAIHTNKLEVVRETKVPAQPWSLAYFEQAALQRPYLVPPTKIDRVYVACREGKTLVALDAKTSAIVGEVHLDAVPRKVRPVAMPNPDWWGGRVDDRVPFLLQPRVAIELWPLYLNLTTLTPLHQPPGEVAEAMARRTSATLTLPNQPQPLSVSADNALLLKIGDAWLDVTAVADPQRSDQRPLTNRDRPGSVTISVDNGPEYDWTRGLDLDPDNQMFLIHGSEDYWAWNAPSLAVKPGKHVLKVRLKGKHARLDAIQVARSPKHWLDLEALPEPQKVHAATGLPGYQGLFYYDEPVRYTVHLTNTGLTPETVRLSWVAENYMGEAQSPGSAVLRVPPGKTQSHSLEILSNDKGRFVLILKAATQDGEVVRKLRFVRLAKLEHPRLLLRREDLGAIRERVALYPRLYERYVDWLRRQAPKGGNWPERFLPPGLTREEMGKAAPESMTNVAQREQAYGWRMYEAGWRMLAVEFAAMYLSPEHRDELLKLLEPLLRAPSTSYYCQYHHHGPFFPGAVAALVDMAPDDLRSSLPLYAHLKARRGDMNVPTWTLLTLEEPLTPADRALVWRISILASNLEQYFTTHQSPRGGTWWQNPWTGCHCPMHGHELSWVYFSNFFDEPRIFDKPFFRGFLTFHRYLDPIEDKPRLLPARRGPNGEPWRWILCALSRHPLEKTLYRWDEWIAKLNGPLPDENQAVDKLFALEGMPYVGPLGGGVHHFVTGVSVPVALALGWYDPTAPTVKWEELPPAALFDADGWAALRSGWDADATEVFFNSGTRDHTPRGVPGHLMLWRAGEPLIGWPALWGDDGNNTPRWANTVVLGDQWLDRWRINLSLPRDDEHLVLNRFSKPVWTYITRDQRLIGYSPAESGWGGGLDLHGHTQTLYRHEGFITAYETSPRFDYVAGDVSNAWTLAEMREGYRQVVYLRPDTVVIYDRILPGHEATSSALLFTTGEQTTAEDSGFTVVSGSVGLRAVTLLPQALRVTLPSLPGGYQWKKQKLVRLEPAEATGEAIEYLTVLRTSAGAPPSLDARLLRDESTVGVALTDTAGQPVEVRFNRPGQPVGGEVVSGTGASATRHALADRIEDTYRQWAADPRYEAWTTQRRFDFVVPPSDKKP